MNLKLRFAFFFTLFVAIILFISSLSIYLLYTSNRVEDYYVRLKEHCTTLVDDYKTLNSDSTALTTTKYKRRTLYDEQILLINPANKIVYKENDTIELKVTSTLLARIKKEKFIRFKQGPSECLGIYNEELGLYVIGSAIDRTGIRKVTKLIYILGGVFGGGLLVSAFMSFVMVQQAFKPLVKLSHQMQQTTSTNLATKLDEGKGRDELEQIAKHFNAMLDRLNQGFERQKSFVQHASHELRTPLTTMLSQTEAALNRELTPTEYKKLLQSLHEEQIELIELTNSLLALSQFEKLSNTLNWPSLRVDELLYESISECKRLFTDIEVQLSFETTPSDEKELLVRGNEVLLKSAFRNLIKNAYLYSDDNKVKILITTMPDKVSVTFINRGTTLSSTDADKLFVPFFRGANASLTKGFGLGLSIINKITEIHNADLTYEALDTHTNKFAISFQLKPMANDDNSYIKSFTDSSAYLYN